MASEYRLVSYTDGGPAPKAGVLIGDRIVPAATLLPGVEYRQHFGARTVARLGRGASAPARGRA